MSLIIDKNILFNTINDSKLFSKEFGCFSKTDYEVLMFTIYMNSQTINNMTDYDIGVELGITESKVRNLRIKSQLLYPKKIDYVMEVKRAISNGSYNIDKKEITVTFLDPVVQNHVKNILEREYRCVGLNFNPKQMTLSIADYLNFALFYEDDKKEVIKKLNKKYKDNIELINKIEKEKFSKEMFSNITDIVSFTANLATIFTGGKPIIDAINFLIKTSINTISNRK